jgi:hypothetical protein
VRGSPGKKAAAAAAIKKAAAGQKPNKRDGQSKRVSNIFNSSNYVKINFHHVHSAYQVLSTTE